jgi:hypothetical protein
MNETEKVLSLTGALLHRAAEIDPIAWASPMPARMQARRNRSYADAAEEVKRMSDLELLAFRERYGETA